jgi:UDP-glucose 4-epimerase
VIGQQVPETGGLTGGHRVTPPIGPGRAADPAKLVASDALLRDPGWHPTRRNVLAIVDTDCRWHQTHPKGYSSAE